MKKLYILRHANAEPARAGTGDFERRLTNEGRHASAAVGRSMADRGLVPDTILCSPAARARETAEIVRDAAGIGTEIEFVPTIYEAGTRSLIEAVAAVDDSSDSALIVGHNPGMEGLVRSLTGTLVPMGVATLCTISLSISRWADAASANAVVLDVIRPERT